MSLPRRREADNDQRRMDRSRRRTRLRNRYDNQDSSRVNRWPRAGVWARQERARPAAYVRSRRRESAAGSAPSFGPTCRSAGAMGRAMGAADRPRRDAACPGACGQRDRTGGSRPRRLPTGERKAGSTGLNNQPATEAHILIWHPSVSSHSFGCPRVPSLPGCALVWASRVRRRGRVARAGSVGVACARARVGGVVVAGRRLGAEPGQ